MVGGMALTGRMSRRHQDRQGVRKARLGENFGVFSRSKGVLCTCNELSVGSHLYTPIDDRREKSIIRVVGSQRCQYLGDSSTNITDT